MHTTYGMDACVETNEILSFGMEVYSRYIPDVCKNLEYVRHIPDICLTYDTIRILDEVAAAICYHQWSIFKISPNPIAKCAQGCHTPRAGPPTQKLSKSSITRFTITRFTGFTAVSSSAKWGVRILRIFFIPRFCIFCVFFLRILRILA